MKLIWQVDDDDDHDDGDGDDDDDDDDDDDVSIGGCCGDSDDHNTDTGLR